MGIGVLFWDVDTQHDFMDEDGKLAVPGAAAIVPNLRRLSAFAVERGIPIVASADAHTPRDPEFDEFGQHCVAGTPGQQKIEATTAPAAEVADPERLQEQIDALRAGRIHQLVIEKQQLDVFTVPLAERILEALEPGQIILYGVATEYCVLMATRALAERGYAVTVVEDAVKGIAEEEARRALEQMGAAGARLAPTTRVLADLTE